MPDFAVIGQRLLEELVAGGIGVAVLVIAWCAVFEYIERKNKQRRIF